MNRQQEADEDVEFEYESSEEEAEPIDGPPPTHLKNPLFLKYLDEVTATVEKHTHREATLTIPNMKISTSARNDASAYLAPAIYVWDPTNCGIKVRCSGGDHHLHKNQWRDCLAYDFTGPIYLRRRLLKCQKVPSSKTLKRVIHVNLLQVGCPNYGKSHLVRDEGVSWYPFFHTSKRVFSRGLYDFVITSCGNGMAFRQMATSLEEGQRQEWVRRKCAWQKNFHSTYSRAEAQRALFGETIPYPDTFPSFQVINLWG